MSLDRDVPQDVEAEQSVIAAAVWTPASLDEVGSTLKPADFYRPAHETIWSAVMDMVEQGIPVDWITLRGHLTDRGEIARIGGPEYLHEIAAIPATAGNIGHYARRVADYATNRRLVASGMRIMQLGYGGGDAAANVSAAQSEILDTDGPVTNTGRYIGPIVEDVMEAAESGSLAVPTMPWGYGPDMPPMPCGRMVVLAGRPGSGKSTSALDAARHIGIHLGLPVAFFSLEMSQAEVGARTAAAEAKIMLPHVQKGEMDADDWSRWARKVGLVLDAPLYVDEFALADPGFIRSTCRRIAREKGPLGLVVVDHLGLMKDDGKSQKSRQQVVSDFSRSLTIMAKEIATAPMLTLAQLNRGSEQRTDKIPVMSDLRESGSIEQDASMVVLVHREDYYEKESPRAGEADFIIAKHRNGATGTVILASQLHYSRFVPMTGDAEPAPAYGAA